MKICSKCNANVEDHMAFCPNCGAPVENATASSASEGEAASATESTPQYQEPLYQQPQYQPQYQQQMGYGPQGGAPYGYMPVNNEPVSLGDWLLTFLITCIPLVGFIMLIVWAVSDSTKESKKNWARARLVWMVIIYILSFIFVMAFGAVFASLLNEIGGLY
ncbi:zinc-ribbon domain-containing protein [Butyrivibrio sp. AE3006]|uniref:zinc-ribbon domain-containing protein n=1 Tax=Butyrivibrio sp. AE3006 TaxID=1280673 RepID=UPI0003F57036|nr:zinc ribbon domain-containing protein [Butyrivibrio sp. AE3006]